jgi:hypothetical protein
MDQPCSREHVWIGVCFVGVRFCLSKLIENHGIDMHKLLPSSPSRMLITEAAVVMCDPARSMLFARIMLILARRSTIRCLLKANSGGRLPYACISGQSIPHLHTLSARGSTAWWQKLGCAGQPVGTQTAIFGLSLVIPVTSPGPPLRLVAREEQGSKGGRACVGLPAAAAAVALRA